MNNPVGSWFADELKAHTHPILSGSNADGATEGLGSVTDTAGTTDYKNWLGYFSTGGLENRPKTSYVLPCIKAVHVDMLSLAQQVAAINGNKADKSSFVNLLSGNGWQQIEGGLILQWGTIASGDNQGYIFPIAFPKNCFAICSGSNEATSDIDESLGFFNITKEGVTARSFTDIGTSGAGGTYIALEIRNTL